MQQDLVTTGVASSEAVQPHGASERNALAAALRHEF